MKFVVLYFPTSCATRAQNRAEADTIAAWRKPLGEARNALHLWWPTTIVNVCVEWKLSPLHIAFHWVSFSRSWLDEAGRFLFAAWDYGLNFVVKLHCMSLFRASVWECSFWPIFHGLVIAFRTMSQCWLCLTYRPRPACASISLHPAYIASIVIATCWMKWPRRKLLFNLLSNNSSQDVKMLLCQWKISGTFFNWSRIIHQD